MPAEALVIDADGHILEPPDLWEKYLDPKYRERAMRIRVAEDGYEYLEIDQKRARLTQPGVLGSLGNGISAAARAALLGVVLTLLRLSVLYAAPFGCGWCLVRLFRCHWSSRFLRWLLDRLKVMPGLLRHRTRRRIPSAAARV